MRTYTFTDWDLGFITNGPCCLSHRKLTVNFKHHFWFLLKKKIFQALGVSIVNTLKAPFYILKYCQKIVAIISKGQ